jgi:DNA-binding LytR/AlgR family response regulator
MNCIIVDDEPLALDLLEDFIKRVPYLNLTGRCTSAFDALRVTREKPVDLIFLDIQMPNINGIEFVKSLEIRPLVIFTTAYSSFALEGFDLGVVDYLVKPIEFSRFLKAVNKAYSLKNPKLQETVSVQTEANQELQDYMMIKVEYSTVRINFCDILYIEGLKDYIKIYTGNRPILTKSTMKHAEEKLPAGNFVRVHKSFIVALSRIESIENNRIMINERLIPVGNEYKENFQEIINRYRL